MPNENLVSFTLTPAARDALKTRLLGVLHDIPVQLNLTAEERQSLPKMSDGTVAFVRKGLAYMGTNPEFIPPYIDVAELERDLGVAAGFLELIGIATQILTMLTDVATEAGSEAYVAVLAYYQSVKQAAKRNVPGAKDIYEDLRQRFPGNSGTGGTKPATK